MFGEDSVIESLMLGMMLTFLPRVGQGCWSNLIVKPVCHTFHGPHNEWFHVGHQQRDSIARTRKLRNRLVPLKGIVLGQRRGFGFLVRMRCDSPAGSGE